MIKKTELGYGFAAKAAGSVAWSLGLLAAGGCMAQTVLTFNVDSALSQTTWQPGQQDITIRLRLSNTGPAIGNILGANFYVVVNGGDSPTTPKVHDVKLIGITGSAVPSAWFQNPKAGSGVAAANTSALVVTFDDGTSDGTGVRMNIPAPDVGQPSSVTPFADITLRREVTQLGTWALQFYIPDSTPGGTSHVPSDFVQDIGNDVATWSVGNLSMQVAAVPEPSTYAAMAGTALLAFGMVRRRSAGTGR